MGSTRHTLFFSLSLLSLSPPSPTHARPLPWSFPSPLHAAELPRWRPPSPTRRPPLDPTAAGLERRGSSEEEEQGRPPSPSANPSPHFLAAPGVLPPILRARPASFFLLPPRGGGGLALPPPSLSPAGRGWTEALRLRHVGAANPQAASGFSLRGTWRPRNARGAAGCSERALSRADSI